ncbi:hypothetical protein BKA62DRAFT_766463 [Auriculariales sp. MPI-PUGE-AT-0066]|nr:hypothetical protein BKA62DRAFT_766463 [Auriculariales sp. MPI-PUGE-AT-0066]
MFKSLLAFISIAVSANGASSGAAYFMTNGDDANHVVTTSIAADGKLTFGQAIGGKGFNANAPGFDSFFSQDPIVVSGNTVLAVNAASNTISAFTVKPEDPTQLKQVGKPVSSQGDFPISIGVNQNTNDIYVLNGGAKNGVAGFKFDGNTGLMPIPNAVRQIGVKQTTPPKGPPTTLTQAYFSLDDKYLLASVKGSPPPGAPGFVAVWEYNASTGVISDNFTAIVAPSGGALPFGFSTLPHNPSVVFLSDPAIGYEVIDLKASLASSNKNSTSGLMSSAARTVPAAGASKSYAIPDQKANCWTAFSGVTGNFYLMDPGKNVVSEVTVNSATLQPTLVKQYSVGAGNVLDAQVAHIDGKDFLYVLSPNVSSIEVFALRAFGNAAHIQSFSYADGLSAAGLEPNSTNIVGMATWAPA